MKKFISLLCITVLLFLFVFTANAQEFVHDGSDSFDIPEEIRSQLSLQEGDQVIHGYLIRFYGEFAYHDAIDEVLTKPFFTLRHYYIVHSADGANTTYYFWEDGYEVEKYNLCDDNIIDACLNADALLDVYPDIQVESTYLLLQEAPGPYSDAVYYRTDRGDYVYYSSDNKYYLFSLEAFCAFWSAVNNYNSVENNDSGGGLVGGPVDAFWDLSAYELGSDSFDPHAPLPPLDKRHPVFPRSGYTYSERAQIITQFAIGILLVGLVIMVVLLLCSQKWPRLLQIKKRWFLLVFLAIFLCLLVCDFTLWDNKLCLDLLTPFLSEGMDQEQMIGLVGQPSSTERIPAKHYLLPLNCRVYVTLDREGNHIFQICEHENTYPLRGFLLPALLAEFALLEAAIFLALRLHAKKPVRCPVFWRVLLLLLILLCFLLLLNMLDYCLIRPLFPELYIHKGMTERQLRTLLDSHSSHFLPSEDPSVCILQFDLLLENTLIVHLRAADEVLSVESCHISGLGDPTYLHYFVPLILTLITAMLLIVGLRLCFRKKRLSAEQ